MNKNRKKQTLLHCAVFIELTAHDLDALKLLQTDVLTELVRSKHGGKQECMGVPALFAIHTHDRKREGVIRKAYGPPIRTMTDEAAGVSAGTGNEIQIKRIYCFIVIISMDVAQAMFW